ncbi:DoxX family protein [Actinoplanes friuliensis]|jgi:hypothetical protein|uniref:DoxX family protein n=1 Tax=Actinoplanes friuliensis DSM 7358 TaxID=1246995 RepID=U5W352_9ACTN|nr:DoxX family protein [Actinoplanes friuliensis]AGZ42361.1 DoxX family protein [Actinoplanes friuliensis DSM 7358]
MNIALWIVAGLLAVAFLFSGGMKVVRKREDLLKAGMGFVEDFPLGAVRAIGALEVLAAIGLILPAVLDIATVLVPLAATGLALMMVGAIIVHIRRGETKALAPNIVLLLLAVFVAWGRFGPYAF